MLDTSKWGAQGNTARAITAQDQLIALGLGQGARFTVPSGNYFYATLIQGHVREVVRVDAVNGDTLSVTRGLDNTTAQPFGVGTCVKVEWNPAQLCEYVQQCASGIGPTGVEPGTYCMTCDTCFEVGADGRIYNVNGSAGC